MTSSEVEKMMGLPMSQRQTEYTTVSPQSGTKQCANCVFFKWSNWTGEYAPPVSACHLVESYPRPILPTGLCNRWEEMTDEEYQPDPLQVVIVDDETKALQLTPKPLGGLDRRLRTMRHKPVDGLRIVKTNEGRLAIVYTANGYVDRDDEAVAQKALARYVERCWEGDTFVGDNVLYFWHMKELGPIGDIVWADMIEGFLVEFALERTTPAASVVYDWLESGEEDTGASHGFYPKVIRVEAGSVVYDEDIEKKETTVLPRQFAANGLTYSGVVKMADVKTQYLAGLLKGRGVDVAEDELAELLKQGPAAINARLAAAGIVPKARKEAESVEPAAEPPSFDALLMGLIDGMAELAGQVDTFRQTVTTLQANATTKERTDGERLKSLEDGLAEVRSQLSLTPRRASEAAQTALSEDEAEKVKENLPTDGDEFWGPAVKKA